MAARTRWMVARVGLSSRASQAKSGWWLASSMTGLLIMILTILIIPLYTAAATRGKGIVVEKSEKIVVRGPATKKNEGSLGERAFQSSARLPKSRGFRTAQSPLARQRLVLNDN